MSNSVKVLLDTFGLECRSLAGRGRILLEHYADVVFDPKWYQQTYINNEFIEELGNIAVFDYVERSRITPFVNPTIWFNETFYREANPDVVRDIHEKKFISGYHHYLIFGMNERRSPTKYFDEMRYLEEHPDVRHAFEHEGLPCGILHYMKTGRSEGRAVHKIRTQLTPEKVPDEDPDRIVEFSIVSGLESNGTPFGFRSLTRDPQFWIATTIAPGFFRLRVQISFEDLQAQAPVMQLFWADESGVREENSLKFPIKNNYISLNSVLYTSKYISGIRLDPLDTRGTFTIEYFSMRRLGEKQGRSETIDALTDQSPERRASVLASINKKGEFFWKDLCNSLSGAVPADAGNYQHWIEQRAIDSAARVMFNSKINRLPNKPLLSVLMPTYKAKIKFLSLAIQSVIDQVYQNWELIIVEDGSCDKEIVKFLEGLYSENRIKVIIRSENSGISAATNVALGVATGEFVVLLDHDDMLAPHALFALVQEINRTPDVDMIYSDEDKITESGHRYGPFFKPDWSPEFMLSCMYTCHLSAYRKTVIQKIGGFRAEFDLAQDYDLALRASKIARAIVHIPDVLYHWRATESSTASGADAKPTAELAARRAVQAAVDAAGLTGKVAEGPMRGTHRVNLQVTSKPLVSIVIPTAARRVDLNLHRWYLLDLLTSIRQKTTYTNYELVLVHNGDMEEKLVSKLKKFNPKYVHYESNCFNISDKLNMGVDKAEGSHVILLNDDMTVVSPSWIEEMLMWFTVPGVAGVGAKLLFPNDTVQHAGVLLLGQGPSHPYYGASANESGLAGSAMLVRNYSAVTGACLMVKTETYRAVGGFDPSFRINYNDVDFCLKIRKYGRIVFTPYALLYHYESVSKDEAPAQELERFNTRWSNLVGNDPAYNRNLSQFSSVGDLGFPPRTLYEDY